MMLPNQITLQSFSQNGKGGYKAVEVDAFLQRVFQSYNKLYNDNKALCEKLDETAPLIEEYNKRKNSIADALIWAKSTAEKNIEEAQSIADKLIYEASEKADKMYEDKKSEADTYYNAKTSEADKRAEKAKAEFESIKKQAEAFSEEYVSSINEKAKAIIEDANAKAASIVADAYADAKAAKEKADAIIASANKELNVIKAEAAKIKNELLSLVSLAQQAAEEVDNRIFEPVEADEAAQVNDAEAPQIDIDDIEPFTLDNIQPEVPEDVPLSIGGNEVNVSQPDFVRFFGTELPDVNDLISDIFTAVSNENNTKKQEAEEDNSFRFTKIFDEPSDRSDTKLFNPKA